MKEQLIHILDQSVCLSRKQMREYLSGTMQREEMHAAEVHLSSCPLCSMAMEGFEEHSEEALAAIAALNSGFLKEHFDNIAPQIHLNSMAPAAALPAGHTRKRGHIQPLWRTASIAAAVVLAFGILWYVEFGRTDTSTEQIAMADETPGSEAALTQPAPAKASSDAAGSAGVTARNQNVPEDADPAATEDNRAALAAVTEQPAMHDLPAKNQAPQPEAAAKAPPAAKETVATLAKKPMREPGVTTGANAVQPPAAAPVNADENVQKTADQIEKTATRNASDIASLAARTQQSGLGARSAPMKYVVDGVQLSEVEAKKESKKERSRLELGNESFDKGKYSAALAHYRQQMNQGSPQERAKAKIMAARCYVALGNKAKAEQLLDTVVSEGTGPERRAARRLLRDLK